MSELMSKKIFRNPFIYLSATDGIILFKKKGIEVRYPSITKQADENILSTMDYLRYALERLDWQMEWNKEWLEEEMKRVADEARPALKLLPGGKTAARDDDE